MILASAIGGLALVAGAAAVAFVRPDVPWSRLRADWGLPESQYIDIGDGITVHAVDTGPRHAPVLVLLHGFGASVHTWKAWLEALSLRMRVVALDLKGFGLTAAPAASDMSTSAQVDLVEKTLKALGVNRFALLGHSMGGGFAWRYALDRPDQVEALVLSGTMGPVPTNYGRNMALYQRLARNPIVKALTPWVMSKAAIARGMLAGFVNKGLATPERVLRAEQLARGPNQRRLLLSMVQAMNPGQGAEALATLATPTLIIHGKEDALVPVEAGQHLAATIPGAQIILYDAIGHVLQEELPTAADDVAAFVEAVWQQAAAQVYDK